MSITPRGMHVPQCRQSLLFRHGPVSFVGHVFSVKMLGWLLVCLVFVFRGCVLGLVMCFVGFAFVFEGSLGDPTNANRSGRMLSGVILRL